MVAASINAPATHIVVGTTAAGDRVFYTGRAGEAFVSRNPTEAFVGWYESGAACVADRLNRGTAFHGITFAAEAAPAAR